MADLSRILLLQFRWVGFLQVDPMVQMVSGQKFIGTFIYSINMIGVEL